MAKRSRGPARIDADAALFEEALRFTAAETGLDQRLIEKDYFASLLLAYLNSADAGTVFKGGTCIAKVHAEFYRLSEDLDFVIPTPVGASRAERSRRAAGTKRAVALIGQEVEGLRIAEPLRGANNSSQYRAAVAYRSHVGADDGTIKIEVGLREPLLRPVLQARARTLLLDPISGGPLVPPAPTRAMSLEEAFAEKFRAALTRREPAIRDFYDIDYAVRRLDVRPHEPSFVKLVARKLAVPGNAAVDVSASRLRELRLQQEARLRPVLRPQDYAEFDLERAFEAVSGMAASVGR